MPYMHCPSCRLATFTASTHSTRHECPRCGTELTAHPRRLFAVPSSDQPRTSPPPPSPPRVA